MNKSSRGKELSRYHIEAAIAYWHTIKEDNDEKWENILQLYNQLLIIRYSQITALNRTYALFKVKGRAIAIEEVEKLELTNNHLYHVLLGYLYTGKDSKKSIQHLKIALKLAKTERERSLITRDLKKVWEYGSMGVWE